MALAWKDDHDALSFLQQVKGLRDDVSIRKEDLPERLKDAAVGNPQLFVKLVDEMISTYEKKSGHREVPLAQRMSKNSGRYRRRQSTTSTGSRASTSSHSKSSRRRRRKRSSSISSISDDDDASQNSRSVVSIGAECDAVEVEFALDMDDGASNASNLSYTSRVAKMIRRMRRKMLDSDSVGSAISRGTDDINIVREYKSRKSNKKTQSRTSTVTTRGKDQSLYLSAEDTNVTKIVMPSSTQQQAKKGFFRKLFKSNKTQSSKKGPISLRRADKQPHTLQHTTTASTHADTLSMDITITPCSSSHTQADPISHSYSRSSVSQDLMFPAPIQEIHESYLDEKIGFESASTGHHSVVPHVVRSFDGEAEINQQSSRFRTSSDDDFQERRPCYRGKNLRIQEEPMPAHGISEETSILVKSRQNENPKNVDLKPDQFGLQVYSPRKFPVSSTSRFPEKKMAHQNNQALSPSKLFGDQKQDPRVPTTGSRSPNECEGRQPHKLHPSTTSIYESRSGRQCEGSTEQRSRPSTSSRYASRSPSGFDERPKQDGVASGTMKTHRPIDEASKQPSRGDTYMDNEPREQRRPKSRARAKKSVRIRSPPRRKKEGLDDERSFSSISFLTDFLDSLDDALNEAIDNNKSIRGWFDSDEKIDSLRKLVKKKNREIPTWLSDEFTGKPQGEGQSHFLTRSASQDFSLTSLSATSFDMLGSFLM
jgi:hypothetical protein